MTVNKERHRPRGYRQVFRHQHRQSCVQKRDLPCAHQRHADTARRAELLKLLVGERDGHVVAEHHPDVLKREDPSGRSGRTVRDDRARRPRRDVP